MLPQVPTCLVFASIVFEQLCHGVSFHSIGDALSLKEEEIQRERKSKRKGKRKRQRKRET